MQAAHSGVATTQVEPFANFRPALAALALAVFAGPALAGHFTFVSQSRMVAASASDQLNNITDGESFSAPDFGPFNQTASASVGLGSGSATMQSTLDPVAGIRVRLDVSVTGSTNFQQAGAAMGNFDVVFDVTETTYGTVELPYGMGGGGVSLSGPEGWTAPFDPLTGPYPLPPTPVVFVPGRYSVSGGVFLGATNGGNGDGIGIVITIPSPASIATLGLPALGLLRRRR
jgi:hypothetical protein